MTLPIGGALCTFVWRANGASRDQTHTLGIHDISVPPLPFSSIGTEVLADFTTAGSPGHAGQFSNDYRFKGVQTTYMDISGPLVFSDPANILGSFARPTPPINCAILVDKRTLTGGRRGRGRMFVPPAPLAEADVDPLGNILAADVTSIQASWTAFFNLLIGHDLIPSLYHATAPFTGVNITAFNVQSVLATQRRRMRR